MTYRVPRAGQLLGLALLTFALLLPVAPLVAGTARAPVAPTTVLADVGSVPRLANAPVPPVSVAPSVGGAGSVISTLSLVSNQTFVGADQPTAQYTPSDIVYDPVNQELYVRGEDGSALSVINGSTNEVTQEISLPNSQNAYSPALTLAVDPTNGTVYASNSNSGNVSILSGTPDVLTGSIFTGGAPNGLVYDPETGDLYVALWSLSDVAVIDPLTDAVLTDVPVGRDPGAIAYDPASEQVFVANWGSGNVSVIDSSNRVVANVATGTDPGVFALDTHDDYIDVANVESSPGHITVIPAEDPDAAYNVSVGLFPEALAYVPAEDQLIVGNSAAYNLSIIDQSDGKVVANIANGNSEDPSAPQTAVYDAADGDVFVLNADSYNVSVVNPADDKLGPQVSLDNNNAYGLAVDTANSDVYAVSEGSTTEAHYGGYPINAANATVIDPSTFRPIASIQLEVLAYSLTYDPTGRDLIVPNPAGNDTYFVDPSTNSIEGITDVGLFPLWAAVDNSTGEIAVVDFTSSSTAVGLVTLLNAQHDLIKSVVTGDDPFGICYDAANGDFYVPDDVAGNVTVINATQNKVVDVLQATADSDLLSIAYDPYDQDVYVGDNSDDTVGVIDSANSFVSWTHVGSDPASFAFDGANGTVFVANDASGNISVLDQSTYQVVHTIPDASLTSVGLLTYDSANNLVYNAFGDSNEVESLNASTYAVNSTYLRLGATDSSQDPVYDPADQEVFVASNYAGAVSAIGSSGPTSFQVAFDETGLPQGTTWSVTLSGAPESSSSPTIAFEEPNGPYSYTVGSVPGYVANVTGGTVHVNGASVDIRIGFTPYNYSVSFVESGLPISTPWTISVDGNQNGSAGTTIGFREPNGTGYSFSVGIVSRYVSNVTAGSFAVHGAPVVIDIGFTYSAAHVAYPVTFTEEGLPVSAQWSVDLNGSTNTSSTSNMEFQELNGSYGFTVGTVSGYRANVTSGTVDVTGAPATVWLGFTAVGVAGAYRVTFTESGLPSGTDWGVAIAGSSYYSATQPNETFQYANGTYAYTIEAVAGYSVSPASGSFTVNGQAVDIAVHYSVTSSSSASSSLPAWVLPVGIIAVVIAGIIGWLVVFFWRRRRKRAENVPPTGAPPSSPPPPAGGGPPPP